MTDAEKLKAIRHLLAADKPEDCLPVDTLQTIALLVRNADEGECRPSIGTLATDLNCSETTIKQSQKRLKEYGWLISHSGKRYQSTNNYTIDIEKLPIGDLRRTVISDDMLKLAAEYKTASNLVVKRQPRRGWQQKYAFTFAHLLAKRCNNDEQALREVLNFVLKNAAHGHALYRNILKDGPHKVKRNWQKIMTAYDQRQAVTQ